MSQETAILPENHANKTRTDIVNGSISVNNRENNVFNWGDEFLIISMLWSFSIPRKKNNIYSLGCKTIQLKPCLAAVLILGGEWDKNCISQEFHPIFSTIYILLDIRKINAVIC